mmetsp:Transcript_11313/g.8317  ORF Transcript_11313/g.8317 Transcript_11313/m.8317 type:complete len:84 (-) Transcript_11313:141-392(-)
MLFEHGILAFSPELGTSDHRTNSFFIADDQVLKSTIDENYPWVKYAVMLIAGEVMMEVEVVEENVENEFDVVVLMKSAGYSKF